MQRTAWIAALVFSVAPGAALAQMGGMMGGMGGGMGRGGMGMNGLSSSMIRRSVQVELEGGRRVSGRIDLGSLMIYGDLGQYAIQPDRIKMIRFLKPVTEPGNDDAQAQQGMPTPAPAGVNNNAQMMAMMRAGNMNNPMNLQMVRAKVILNSGEEIIGNLQQGMGFHIAVDYGTMTPALDKMRSMAFGEIEKKAGTETKAAAGTARSDGDARVGSAAPPSYFRYHQTLVIRSSSGDRVTLHDTGTRHSQDLSGPKDPPLAADPIYSTDLMALSLQGAKIARIAAAEAAGGWHVLDLRHPAEGDLTPIVAQGVAVYSVGRHVYAYGAEAHRWDVAELPEELVPATPVVGPNQATIEAPGHIFEFSSKTGRWQHIDVQSILDAAKAEKP